MRIHPMVPATLLAAGAVFVTSAQAQDLMGDRPVGEIAFTDDTMQLRYRDAGRNVDVGRGSRASAAIFLSEARDLVFFGDLLFPADIGAEQLQLTFGPRMYAALLEDENNDVLSLSLGGEARFELTSKLAVAAQAFYAPDILTFRVSGVEAQRDDLSTTTTTRGGMAQKLNQSKKSAGSSKTAQSPVVRA